MTEPIRLSEFAKDHGLTLRRVQQWIAEGMPYRDVDGERRIVRADANRWVREREREQAMKAANAEEKNQNADQRRSLADAQLAELKLARELGQVVAIDQTEAAVSEMLGQLRAQLLTLPQRWAPRVIGLKTLPEAMGVLEAAVNESLTALSGDP